MSDETKVQQNRVRRKATRRGLKLVKSRRRDPKAVDFGKYMLVDIGTNAVVFGSGRFGPDADLAEIEQWLDAD